MRTLAVLTLAAATANVASAAITMEVVEVDNSSQLTGYVTQDLVVTTDTDWLWAEMTVQPDADGLIYQDQVSFPNAQSPNPAFFGDFPSLEFDTYVSNGELEESVTTEGLDPWWPSLSLVRASLSLAEPFQDRTVPYRNTLFGCILFQVHYDFVTVCLGSQTSGVCRLHPYNGLMPL